MDNISQDNQEIAQQASAWFALFDSGEVSAEQYLEFELWRGQSEQHAIAYADIELMWEELKHARSSLPVLNKETNIVPITKKRKPIRKMIAMAASVMFVAFCLNLYWNNLLGYTTTASGEISELKLDDNSVVTLSSESAAKIAYDSSHRNVYLKEGEAYFKVSADPDRPFTVIVKDVSVTALGTEFNIKVKADSIEVTGVVHDISIVTSNRKPVILTPGQQLIYGDGGATAVSSVDTKDTTLWQQHKIVFRDKPLVEVVEELNRYSSQTIKIVDKSLEQKKVSGLFSTNATGQAIKDIVKILKIESTEVTPYLLLLH
ncbi:MAG: DUF4974 domain-containing protein [Gammaproteobacteria bacterium]|nr:MAG: DUF4974 domain-containing protein [Gammaproteobacteria bacterium]